MKGLLIVVTLAVSALARPDIGLKLRQQGYNYQPPSTNYGIPTGSYLPASGLATPYTGGHHINGNGGSGAATSQGLFTQSGNSGLSGPGGFSSGHIHGVNGGSSLGSLGGFSGSGSLVDFNSRLGSGSLNGFNGGSGSLNGFNGGSGSLNGFNSGSGLSGSGFSSQGGFSGGSSISGSSSSSYSGVSQVQKHVYFYDAPEDHEAQQLRIRVQPSEAKENIKIIFIKTPTYKAPVVPQIPVQTQSQEKTRVYVLVKKQDDAQEIIIPTATPTKPSKPEVFFIKYKTQKEAEEKIKNIQQGGNTGINANDVGSDSFVSTITDTRENHNYDAGSIAGIDTRAGDSGIGLDVNSFSSGSVTTNFGHDADHSHDSSNHVSDNSQISANYGPAGASGPY